MSESSLGKFRYTLRPAKNIERKMFCEAFYRLSRIAPLSSYRYIGFGSTEFCDFRLFHERLGIKDMVSIEERRDARERVEFNRPHSCIKMEWGSSYDVLPTLDWSRRTIVWLDYDKPLDAKKLDDISLIAGNAKSGSVLLVTVPANPGDASEPDVVNKRLNDLKERVGKNKVPPSIEAKHLSTWGTAKAYREIVHNEILQTLNNRCAPLSSDAIVAYVQLFNFHYSDGTKMLTVGGIFLDQKDSAKLSANAHFDDLEFIRSDDKPYMIETPILTWREVRYLDKLLPCSAVKLPEWLPKEQRERYRKVYRYYPNFTEVEA